MGGFEEVQKEIIKKKRAEERNPLLKMNLGELVREMQRIALKHPMVLMERDHMIIPQKDLIDYKKYDTIIEEINRREKEYQSYKPEPRCR